MVRRRTRDYPEFFRQPVLHWLTLGSGQWPPGRADLLHLVVELHTMSFWVEKMHRVVNAGMHLAWHFNGRVALVGEEVRRVAELPVAGYLEPIGHERGAG